MKRLASMLGIIAFLISALMAAPKAVPKAMEDLTGKWAGSFVISMGRETKNERRYGLHDLEAERDGTDRHRRTEL